VTRLPVLVLEPHSRCNCRCVMCDIWKTTDAREISAAELQRHLADIERLQVEWVVFSGGEPLMHSDLFALAGMIRQRGIRATILSTGLLLERYAAQIVANIDDVIVSLDGPPEIHNRIRQTAGAFEHLAAGVRAIHQRNPDYPISARSTVQALNASCLRATAQAARSIGLRSISFLAADLSSTAFNRPQPWPEERRASVAPDLPLLEAELDALIASELAAFVVESPDKLRRIAAHFRARLGLEPFTAPRCNAPWVSAVVEPSGDVRPCFFHPPIGNTAEGTLLQVLNSPRAVAFRSGLQVAEDPTCRQCVCSLYREMPSAQPAAQIAVEQ
jgi:MoaA/NifB/PqqE/SkfB family radical SAM enzyme